MSTSSPESEGPPAPDVFISYSRKDKAFVLRLNEELKRRGREAWVDWEDIRPTEEFMRAIYGAIEGTDTFVFVLSPDSIASDVCRREIAHASRHSKRMIPVVAREVDAANVPQALARLNWIFARATDDLEAAVGLLISAMEMDLDWIHAHTRLLTRALEWEAHRKSNSFTLRGEDLKGAERWLAEAGTKKERQPTGLQTEYIIASRKAAARRQRIILGAVTFGAIVATVLAIAAFVARNRAETERGNAEAATKRATHSRDEAVKLIDFMSFDLRDKLQSLGRLDLLEDVNQRVRAFNNSYEGEEDSDLLRQRGALFNNQGNIARSKGDLSFALENYRESLKAFERLAQRAPGKALWQRNISVNLGAIAIVLRSQGNLKGALENQQRSLALVAELLRKDPDNRILVDDLSDSYSDLGDMQRDLGDFAAALQSYRAGLELSAKLTVWEPGNRGWQRDLSLRQERVADMKLARGDVVGAFESYRQSLDLARRLVQEEPQNTRWQSNLAGALLKVADLQSEQGDSASALQTCQESLRIAERLSQLDPANAEWLRELSVGYNQFGALQDKEGNPDGALQSYRAGLAIRDRLARQDQSNVTWQRDLSLAHANIGNILRQRHDWAGALASYLQCLAIREGLIARAPANVVWQHDLAIAHRDVGEMQMAQGKPDAALVSMRASVSFAEKAAGQDSSNAIAQRDLLNSYSALGGVQQMEMKFEEALQSYERALVHAEKLAQQGSRSEVQADLADINLKTGVLLYAVDDKSKPRAQTLLERSRATFLDLKARRKLSSQEESGLELAESSLHMLEEKPARKIESSGR